MYFSVYSCQNHKALIALFNGLELQLEAGDEIKVAVYSKNRPLNGPLYEVAYHSQQEITAAFIPDVKQIARGIVS